MGRTRSANSIDTELGKIQEELAKLQEKEETLKARHLELKKTEVNTGRAKQIMEAYQKSNKSFEELLSFLDI